ncbi:hypothetical protein THUN1379_26960 [Paludibacterium sp. THUN1379]|uniref:hypothetical protein n=1 Tax=Paludibacterium sp. THUN1379 TaxID=3112107 RepID=UPI003090FAAA|nr:hypothetical protein THUN1379_26960 [Paludibacterium sp. THUN1379]
MKRTTFPKTGQAAPGLSSEMRSFAGLIEYRVLSHAMAQADEVLAVQGHEDGE